MSYPMLAPSAGPTVGHSCCFNTGITSSHCSATPVVLLNHCSVNCFPAFYTQYLYYSFTLAPDSIVHWFTQDMGLGVLDMGLAVLEMGLAVPDMGLGVPDMGLGVLEPELQFLLEVWNTG